MKKNYCWSFLFCHSESAKRLFQVKISSTFAVILVILMVIGIIGFGRLVVFTASYGLARFEVYQKKNENQGLLLKIKFLTKYIQSETERIESLVNYEDKARMTYGMKRISGDVRKAGIGGIPSKEEMMMASFMDPIVLQAESVRENLTALLRQAELQDSTFSRLVDHVSRLHDRWAKCPSIWPTNGRVTSQYGYRYHPIAGHRLFHEGLDIANNVWTPIFATADGIVTEAGYKNYYGKLIQIDHHGSDYTTLYAHLHQFAVTKGQAVRRGELIGYMGNTGRSTGPHLHYEVRLKNKNLNPLSFFLPSESIVD